MNRRQKLVKYNLASNISLTRGSQKRVAMNNSIPPIKLIIQIPCLNEEHTLPETIGDLPNKIEGKDVIETLIIDDGTVTPWIIR